MSFAFAELDALREFIREQTQAHAIELGEPVRLSGGAIQENWLLTLVVDGGPHAGRHEWVLRRDAGSSISLSHGRAAEFALLSAAFEAGATVPQPLWLCTDTRIIGSPFFVMRKAAGVASGHLIVKQQSEAQQETGLAERIGMELARIHTIRPPRRDLPFLALSAKPPALEAVEQLRLGLDALALPRPALEWGLSWLERNAMPSAQRVLCHRDFRTGNYMVDANQVTAILDWEFAAWGDPMEDIGWFCARCWRFSRPDREAGGVGSREDFYRGYESVSGVRPDAQAVFYWEVMAHVRWALIALQQANRASAGGSEALVLALTGHIVPELELGVLRMTKPTEAERNLGSTKREAGYA